MSEYYYNTLDPREKKVYRAALNGLNACRPDIRVPAADMERFSRIITLLSFDHPEIFYVDFHRFTVNTSGTSLIWDVDYLYPKKQIIQLRLLLEEKVSRILASGKNVCTAPPLEKCRWIHDTLVKNVSYNQEALRFPEMHLEAYSVLGVFRKRSAVCEGISLAVEYLGERLGISLPVITGKGISDRAGLDDSHGWNLLTTDGKHAHLDVTWDLCLSAPLHFIRYDYFCLPDDLIRTDHAYSGTPHCDAGSGLTFFEQTRRQFTELRQCESYISKKLKEGRRSFYFQLLAPDDVLAKAERALEAMLLRKMPFFFPFGAILNSSHNLKLGIFFYRISEGGEDIRR